MNRRLTTFVLAAFYLLQATWLLHAGVDLLFPKIVEVVAAPISCCARTCGCPEEVQKANACCCAKTEPSSAEASEGKPVPVASAPRPVSAIEMARCQGAEAAMIQAFTQPVVCAFADLKLVTVAGDDVLVIDHDPSLKPLAVSVDKVPI